MFIGRLFCSTVTAALLKLKLKIPSTVLLPLELEKTYNIKVGEKEIEVTLMDANHCPGAVCILFKVKNGQKIVLHTGDFRWNENMLSKSKCFRNLVSLFYLII